ncbi:hypothetical protein DESUT3_09090 [Desulfuromonas versatilis]|uniref:Ig-like domain-containing protein n=1 Tax=Desulfuromonas versatilis TaxID=2802975 RepID=A0ABN6DUS5_9BACT|nr:hypothetical protein [Desulfuromonas versatilis]BCR03840.1 hypothetical protein DESUT3_09090 [Desulfuromonas versatilis]
MNLKLLVCLLLFGLTLAGCGAMSPDADPGENQAVTLGDTVTLSAAGSDKRNGDDLSYRWTSVSAPAGSSARLSDATAMEPTFTPDMVGEYVFELVVDNDFHKSAPVRVTVRCRAPGEGDPVVFATDSTGKITLLDLLSVEDSRTAERVNFSLNYTLTNQDTVRADISVLVFALDAAGSQVFSHEIKQVLEPGVKVLGTITLSGALTIAEFESIVEWKADPITVLPATE